jgi:hypothetical protein
MWDLKRHLMQALLLSRSKVNVGMNSYPTPFSVGGAALAGLVHLPLRNGQMQSKRIWVSSVGAVFG